MSSGSYQALIDKIGLLESSDRYSIENSLHYLGRYQLGEAALTDVGLVNADKTPLNNDYSGGWNSSYGGFNITGKTEFLTSQPVQDTAVKDYLSVLYNQIKSKGLLKFDGQNLNGHNISLSGLVVGAYLVGAGGLSKYLNSGGDTVPTDGFGTPITSRIDAFYDYDVPFSVDHSEPDPKGWVILS